MAAKSGLDQGANRARAYRPNEHKDVSGGPKIANPFEQMQQASHAAGSVLKRVVGNFSNPMKGFREKTMEERIADRKATNAALRTIKKSR